MDAQVLEAGNSTDPVFSEASLKIILLGVLIYWGVIALTFPVTNWDSQVYNLARLWVCLTITAMPTIVLQATSTFSLAFFSNRKGNRVLQAFVGLLVIWSAISSPFLTTYQRPADLYAAFRDGKKFQFSERTEMRPVYKRVLEIRSSAEKVPWFLIASENSWTLPFISLPHTDWRLTPQWSMIADWERNNPGKSAYILALQRSYQNELPAQLEGVYPGSNLILKIPGANLQQ